ncbi:MAG TPA: FxLYD domain-containing protein [Bryobacteraceae bacterium]|nr:FxLYD domain-containing protein [Bryobacteraceae bacterium]
MTSKTSIYTLAIALVLAGGLIWFVNRPHAAVDAAPLSSEAKAYVRNLQLSDVSMKATESYAGQTVTEIEGKIANAGSRTVQHADVYCVFYNSYGQVILRERVPIVAGGLKPGEMRTFRLPFDDIPGSWNNQMPQLVIARIEFV